MITAELVNICQQRLNYRNKIGASIPAWCTGSRFVSIITETIEKYGLLDSLQTIEAEFFADSVLMVWTMNAGRKKEDKTCHECARILNALIKSKGLLSLYSGDGGIKETIKEDGTKTILILSLYRYLYNAKERYSIEYNGIENISLPPIDNVISILNTADFRDLSDSILEIEEALLMSDRKLQGRMKKGGAETTTFPLMGISADFLLRMNADLLTRLGVSDRYCLVGDLVRYCEGVNFPAEWDNRQYKKADKYRMVCKWLTATNYLHKHSAPVEDPLILPAPSRTGSASGAIDPPVPAGSADAAPVEDLP